MGSTYIKNRRTSPSNSATLMATGQRHGKRGEKVCLIRHLSHPDAAEAFAMQLRELRDRSVDTTEIRY